VAEDISLQYAFFVSCLVSPFSCRYYCGLVCDDCYHCDITVVTVAVDLPG